MVYVGIDLHRNRSQIAVLDQQGTELLSRRIVNDPETFLALLAEVGDVVGALRVEHRTLPDAPVREVVLGQRSLRTVLTHCRM